MTRAVLLVSGYAALALLWAVPALYAGILQQTHRNTLANLQAGTATPTETLGAIRTGLRFSPCHPALQRTYLLLLGHQADKSLATDGMNTQDQMLSTMQNAIAARLECRPLDGKAWLSYAQATFEREGFSKRVREAYRQSARVSPRESWLAQQRIAFALHIAPMMDESLREVAHRDIAVLNQANHYRLNEILKRYGISSIDALQAIFAAPASSSTEDRP